MGVACPTGFDLLTRAGGLLGQARAVEARSADLMRRCRVLHAGIVCRTAPRVADVRTREKFQGE